MQYGWISHKSEYCPPLFLNPLLNSHLFFTQDERIIDVPRQRRQTKRYGNEDGDFELSDLEEEEEVIVPRRAAWTRVECFRVEKNLLIYG